MEQLKAVDLLRKNFQEIEVKFGSYFSEKEARWPGEKHDLLRNHHKNLDNLSMKNLTFEKLGIIELPEQIVKELELAFDCFREGRPYQPSEQAHTVE